MSCDVGEVTDSFSNPSIAFPTSQLILQHFRYFTYVTAHSPTLPLLLLCHRLFTYRSSQRSWQLSLNRIPVDEPWITKYVCIFLVQRQVSYVLQHWQATRSQPLINKLQLPKSLASCPCFNVFLLSFLSLPTCYTSIMYRFLHGHIIKVIKQFKVIKGAMIQVIMTLKLNFCK